MLLKESILPHNICLAVMKSILKIHPELKHAVFDPNQSYDNSIKSLRTANMMVEASVIKRDKTELPMISWNRDAIQINNRPMAVHEHIGPDLATIEAATVTFKINWIVYTTNTDDLESFEF